MSNMFPAQTFILKFWGLIPLKAENVGGSRTYSLVRKVVRLLPLFVGSVFFVAQILSTLIDVEAVVFGLLNPKSMQVKNGVLFAMGMAPPIASSLRALVVLLLFRIKHRERLELEELFLGFNSADEGNVKWHRLSKISFVITATLVALWYGLSTYLDFVSFDKSDLSYEFSIPFPKITWWQYYTQFGMFQVLPFMISQQVYLFAILSAKVLANSVDDLANQIQLAVTRLENHPKTYDDSELREQVAHWQELHMRILKFTDKWNETFSLIVFAVYCLDFITVLGYLSQIANHIHETDPIHLMMNIGSLFYTVLFATYGTVFAVPFVQENDLVRELERFSEFTRVRVCVLTGAHLFYYTRGFVVGTFTVAISLTVMTKEVIGKEAEGESVHHACECSDMTFNRTLAELS